MKQLAPWLIAAVFTSGCSFSPAIPSWVGDASSRPSADAGLGEDTGLADAEADAGVQMNLDAADIDAELPDAEPNDMGFVDAEPVDLGPQDTGADAGFPEDMGFPDTGADAGFNDSGVQFPFTVSNVQLSQHTFSGRLVARNYCVFDTTNQNFSGCSEEPTSASSFRVSNLVNGLEVLIVSIEHLEVSRNGVLEIQGDRAAIFLVDGEAKIDGLINASADLMVPGPGGDNDTICANFGRGSPGSARGGGGGGGFALSGGEGGNGTGLNAGGAGGFPFGTTDLIPLVPGCSGGESSSALGGGGGGALQISASDKITLNGRILTAGGAGLGGRFPSGGGGGGGSGGSILLEAKDLDLKRSGIILAGGGGGGEGAEPNRQGARGEGGSFDDASPAPGGDTNNHEGGDGGDGGAGLTHAESGEDAVPGPVDLGGGGGGGAVGRIRLNASNDCDIHRDTDIAPAASKTANCP